MSTHTKAETSAAPTAWPPEEIIVIVSPSGANQRYHLFEDCRVVKHVDNDVRKSYRNRPLTSECCGFCRARAEDAGVEVSADV